jgi:hypothetical protein
MMGAGEHKWLMEWHCHFCDGTRHRGAHLVQFGLEVFQQADVFEVHTTPQVTWCTGDNGLSCCKWSAGFSALHRRKLAVTCKADGDRGGVTVARWY